jgi:Holliday junction resolvase RusA-like endonuclease
MARPKEGLRTGTPKKQANKSMIKIVLLGKVVPKARPRFDRRGHVHMPSRYTEWKQNAVIDLRDIRFVTSGKVSLEITFINAIRGNADCDNAAGSIMDALVESGVLCGDSAATIGKLVVENYQEKKPKIAPQILIVINNNYEANIDKIRGFLA